MMNPKQQKRADVNATTMVKSIIETRENGSRRVSLDFSDCTSRTKQEYVKESNINNIAIIPPKPIEPLAFADLRNPPDLAQVFKTVYDVRDGFAQLPSSIRSMMGNDPSKLQAFITNPDNYDLLVKRGVLIEREAKTKSEGSISSPKPSEPDSKGSTKADSKSS